MDTIPTDRETQILHSHTKRKLNQLKRRRKLRKTKIFISRARIFAQFIAFFVLAVFLWQVMHLPQWYLNTTNFSENPNEYAEIEGNKILSSKQILAKIKKVKLPHKPIYLISTKEIENKILELTPVKKVFIRRYWFPARLRIVLDERTPVLSVSPTPKVPPVGVFTKDDNVIKILGREYLPLPESKETYRVITYDQYSLWKPSLVQYISDFASYVEDSTGQKLDYIDIRNPDDVFVQLKTLRLRIGRIHGSTTFSNIEKTLSVLPEALKIKHDIEYIDLRWDNVSIKLKDKKKEAEKEKSSSSN